MSLSIRCKISLSKKLRAVVGEKATVILMADSLESGKGEGQLSITSESMDDYGSIPEELDGETSISITPISMTDDMPRESGVSNIFSSVPSDPSVEPLIAKLAAVQAPEAGEESRAVQGNPETPTQFAEVDDPDCKTYISNLGELLDAIGEAKVRKQEPVDLTKFSSDREKAVALEQMERSGMIVKPAYIVNKDYAIITVNDLDIDLPQNMPFNLGNLPVQKVAESVHLRQLLKGGLIQFVSPEEASAIMSGLDSQESIIPELEVFDTPEQAEASMAARKSVVIDEDSAMDLSGDDIDGPTEEEAIINLTGVGTSALPAGPSDGSVRVSSHSSGASSRPQANSDKKPALPTIKRVG